MITLIKFAVNCMMKSENGRFISMKVVGLVTEYNPFHNGHKYHIEEAKKSSCADYAIAVMSGDFVQRGAPAVIDKYSRAEMAIKGGADLVLELPVCYATASAEYFALGAVSLLDKLGIVDSLCFGSECGDISSLKEVAGILAGTTEEYDKQLLSYVKEGLTYPAAREKAITAYLRSGNASHSTDPEQAARVLSSPNNILGMEYIKAIHSLSSPLRPVTIQRKTAGYHEKELSQAYPDRGPAGNQAGNQHEDKHSPSPVISSATAIRTILQSSKEIPGLSPVTASVPDAVYEILVSDYHKTYPITWEDFSSIIKYKLLSEDRNLLNGYVDMSGDLADRIKKNSIYACTMEELALRLKTKNLTLTRINRALTHILLNIRKTSLKQYCQNGYTSYARVLGIKKESSHLLRRITDIGRIPVITKVAKAEKQIDPLAMQMLSEDLFAAHLYNQAVYEKYGTPLPNEYQRGILIV
jgi:predicted nucleotidyltransferase